MPLPTCETRDRVLRTARDAKSMFAKTLYGHEEIPPDFPRILARRWRSLGLSLDLAPVGGFTDSPSVPGRGEGWRRAIERALPLRDR